MESKQFIYYTILALFFSLASLYFSSGKIVWRDEAFSILVARQNISQIIQTMSQDFNPPLFYIILHYWQKILGENKIVLRFLPLIFSLITLFLSFRWSELIFKSKQVNKLLRPLFFFLLIITPTFLYFSFELRNYSMLMLIVFASTYFAIKCFQTGLKKEFIFLSLINILGLYTHSLGMFWLLGQMISLNIIFLIKRKKDLLPKLWISFVVCLIFYLPWAQIVIAQSLKLNDFWLHFDKRESLRELSGLFAINEGLVSDEDIYIRIYEIFRWFIIAGLLIGLIEYSYLVVIAIPFVLTIFLMYYFSNNFNPIFYSRYLAFLTPLAIILTTICLAKFKQISKFVFGLLIFSYVYLCFLVFKDYYKGISKTDYEKLKNYNVDCFYVSDDLDILPCMYYSHACIYVGSGVKDYIGFNQLADIEKKQLTDWANIKGKKIGVLYEDNSKVNWQEINKLNYQKLSHEDLGNGVSLEIFSNN